MPYLPYFGPFVIQHCAPGEVDPHWEWSPNQRKEWSGLLLWVVAKGRGEVVPNLSKDSEPVPVARGDVLIMRWDRPKRARTSADDPLFVPWCSFDWSDESDRQRWEQEAPDMMLRRARDPDYIAGCMQRVVDEHALGHLAGAKIFFQATLAEFAASPRYGNDTQIEWGHKIRQLCRAIQNSPEHHWSVAEMAATFNCDADHFARMFRREVGEPPGRYLIRCRIDHARHLLIHSEDTIATIAAYLGYSDAFFFSKQFKQFTGLSPRDFRKMPPGSPVAK